MNYSFGKNICAESVNSGGAVGEWLTDEFSTDLDEMGIFVLSKDQTFRICAQWCYSNEYWTGTQESTILQKVLEMLIKLSI